MPLPVFELHLSLEGVAKERPRFNRKTGSAYTPTRTVQYERELAKAMTAAGAVPRSESEDLELHCQFGISTNRRKDLDNLQKSLLDAGNGVLYSDDKQVVRLQGSVEYGVEPYVSLQLYSLGARPHVNARSRAEKKPAIVDCSCGRDHQEMPMDSGIPLVCVEHKRHVPCRSCAATTRGLPSGYDLCPQCQKRAKRISIDLCRECSHE